MSDLVSDVVDALRPARIPRVRAIERWAFATGAPRPGPHDDRRIEGVGYPARRLGSRACARALRELEVGACAGGPAPGPTTPIIARGWVTATSSNPHSHINYDGAEIPISTWATANGSPGRA